MATWRPHADDFLNELLRRDGLVTITGNPICSTCHESPSYVTNVGGVAQEVPDIIRCLVGCHGGFVECRPCSLQRHRNLPLHRITVIRQSYCYSKPLLTIDSIVALERTVLGAIQHTSTRSFYSTWPSRPVMCSTYGQQKCSRY